jgi:hypothetical protein
MNEVNGEALTESNNLKNKHMKSIARTLPLILLLLMLFSFMMVNPSSKDEKKKYISIEDAIKNKIVTARITGKGGHTGECIDFEIKSLIDDDTLIRIEPGRHLVAGDSVLQDILIIKEIQLLLAGKEKKVMNIFGFCCEATNRSPGKGSKYSVGYMADSSFIKLAMFLSTSDLPLDVMQNAVWVLSNNHPINSISNENENDKPKMKELYKLIASTKGLEMKFPWYTLKYKMDTAVLFTNRPVKLFGEFEYSLVDPAHVDLIIRDSRNNPVTTLIVNRPQNPDNYNHRFTLDVSNWPKGKYYAILFIDNQLRIKREFEL